MPWNDNANPGPWGSPPGGDGDRREPQGRRSDGGGPRGPGRPDGPDLGALLRRLGDRLRAMLGGPGAARPGVLVAVVGAAFGLWALSGVYIVQPNEQAVITTFGAYTGSAGPGVNYHLPAPIQRVEKVAVTDLNRTDVSGSDAGSDDASASLMLTGDEQIVDLDFSVTWRINDPARYLFSISNPTDAVRAAAESAMREVVGKTPLQPILSTGRGQVQQETAELMQKTLDDWGSGISVVEVQIRSSNPPSEVVEAFRDVINAQQDADSAVNKANTYYNRVVNEAKGSAAAIVQNAEAYRSQAELEAKGEAARFNQLYAEYRRAPAVTRQRLYIETMQRVLQDTNKVVIDSKGATAPIILPPDVFRPKASPAPAQAGDGSGDQPSGKAAQ